MRKWIWRILAFLLLLCAIGLFPWAMRFLPIQPQNKLKPSKPEWEGILSVGIVQTWSANGFPGWLNAQVRALEKEVDGLLVSVRTMEPKTVEALRAAGQLPDVLIFGPGVLPDPENLLLPLTGELPARAQLLACGTKQGKIYAAPVAAGAYGLIGNQNLLDQMQLAPDTPWAQMGEKLLASGKTVSCAKEPYSLPMAALLTLMDGAAQAQPSLLASGAGETDRAKVWPDFALEQKFAWYAGTQRDVQRIALLAASGRAFDTVVYLHPQRAYSDLMLLVGVVDPARNGHGGDGLQRAQMAGKLVARLLSQEAQQALGGAGLFAVRTLPAPLYTAGTGMAALEQSLAGELLVPNAFDFAAQLEGARSQAGAAALLEQLRKAR